MSLQKKIANCSKDYDDIVQVIIDPKGASKSQYVVNNQNKTTYQVINFDGCVFNNTTEKCDYGMDINNVIHFVELKGTKNNKGLSQLLETIKQTNDCYSNYTKKVRLIVSKRKAPHFIDAIKTRDIGLLIDSTLDDKDEHFVIRENNYIEYIK